MAAMKVPEVEDHGKEGRKVGEEAEAGDKTQASQVTAKANHTPHILEEPSTTSFYTLIDMTERVLVASDYKSLFGTESVIIPWEHKIESIDTGNNDIKNNNSDYKTIKNKPREL